MASLIVEDGTIVAGANSFLSLVDARTLADNRGIDLPVDDDAAIDALIQGGIYVNNQESSLQGARVSADQTMCYPRSGVTKYTFDVASDSIPDEIKCAQVESAASIGAGVNPYAVDTGKEVKLQEVTGSVKREFFESGKTNSNITITTAINCLYPLTLNAIGGGNFFNFNVQRA